MKKKIKKIAKKKTESADIIFILDRSSSMESIKTDVIGGFNKFIKEQQKLKAKIGFSLVQFNDHYEIVYKNKPVKSIEPLTEATFVPRGWTALHDAIGKTVNSKTTGADKTIVVILTDGFENASKEYTADAVKALIKDKTEKDNWQFVFLGADQDAILTAKGLGISASNSMTFAKTRVGTQAACDTMMRNTSAYISGQAVSMSFTEEDRKKQEEELKK